MEGRIDKIMNLQDNKFQLLFIMLFLTRDQAVKKKQHL